jgi:hypothetical protein
MQRTITATILIMGLAALYGCGTLNNLVVGSDRAHVSQAMPHPDESDTTTTLLEYPLNTLGRLNLGIESLDDRQTDLQLGGDDGATLNAYAACLTLKVSF